MLFTQSRHIFHNFYFRSILGIIVVVIIPIITTSIFSYGQPLSVLIRRPLMYAGFLIFPLLFFVGPDKKFPERWMNIFVAISIVAAILTTLASMYPNITYFLNEETVSNRFGKTRIGRIMETPILIAFFYCLSILFNIKIKFRSFIFLLICIALLIYPTIFVNLSRGKIIGICLTFIFFIVYHLSRRKSLPLISIIIILLFSYLSFSEDTVSTNIFTQVSESVKQELLMKDGTIGQRISGIEYYYDEFRQSSFIGIGMVSAEESIENPISYGQFYYRYNFNDLGFFGVILQFGFPAIILTIIILRRIFNDLIFIMQYGNVASQNLAMGLYLYLIYGCITFQHLFFLGKNSFYFGIIFYLVYHMRYFTEMQIHPPSSIYNGHRV